ncbi:MAG: aldo/keto reductase [Saprospiraceae bacterium]|nr:aldo/keto reductase [Saprospiraceae bacterium]
MTTRNRRSFLKTLATATTGLMVVTTDIHGLPINNQDRLGDLLPLRKLGKTGVDVTMLGVGGAHIGKSDEKTAQAILEAALEGGVRFFDNAESYNKGGAEEKYGKYLVPKYRDVAFIMTKSTAKDGKLAQQHLEDSLRRMKTDYVDLWQIHAVTSPKDVDDRIANGVLEVARKAKESGKARFIGFTGHSDFHAHQRMLERTDILETCQMPINCFDPSYKSFINNVLPTLVDRNMGILAMKSLSNGGFFGGTRHFNGGDNPKLVPEILTVEEALHFVWSLPVSVLITGPDHAQMMKDKITVAKNFKQMQEDDRLALLDRVSKAGYDGKLVEFYKV